MNIKVIFCYTLEWNSPSCLTRKLFHLAFLACVSKLFQHLTLTKEECKHSYFKFLIYVNLIPYDYAIPLHVFRSCF